MVETNEQKDSRIKNYGEILLEEIRGLRNDFAILYDELMFANLINLHKTYSFTDEKSEEEFKTFAVAWMDEAYALLKQDRKSEEEENGEKA